MDTPNSKGREQLKSYFVKNAIPTEAQFADLIEAGFNLRDDGLVKTKGNPLSIEAGGNNTSQKKVLTLYRDASDAEPACVFSLSPYGDPADETTKSAGLGIGDAKGNTRLFIDPDSGQIGLGTATPEADLHVKGQKIIFEKNDHDCYLVIKSGRENAGYSYLQLLDATDDGFEFGYRAESDAMYFNSKKFHGWSGAELIITPHTKGTGSGENAVTISTTHGYGSFGAISENAFHFGTDRPRFYFNKPIHLRSDLLGAAQNQAGEAQRVRSGATSPDDWKVYTERGIYVDIDASSAGFESTPIYIASLTGSAHHWATTGGSCIYQATKAGFRIHVRWIGGDPLTPEKAKASGWYITWVAIGN